MIVRPEEWIAEPDEEGNGLLRAWVVSGNTEYPIPIETHAVSLQDVRMDQEQEFNMILECENMPEVYRDEAAYEADKRFRMAAESVIPAGLFSPTGDENFVPSGRIILSGIVSKTYEDSTRFGFAAEDTLYSLSCLGNEYDAVLHEELCAEGKTMNVQPGNVVSGVYWVQGWPSDMD